jgi:hypothetical protein
MASVENLTKSVVVNFGINEVAAAVYNFPNYFDKAYTLRTINDVMNIYTFSALETLSLGVYIDITLKNLTADKTEIHIEIRRKVGSFDEAHEVENANTHMSNVLEAISVFLKNPNYNAPAKSAGSVNDNRYVIPILAVLIVLVALLLVFFVA